MFGLHYLGEGTGCEASRLTDPELARRTLLALAAGLELQPVAEPQVHVHEDGQVVAILLLSESHASLHTLPKSGTVFADVFACRPFEPTKAAGIVVEAYAPRSLRQQVVERGPR